MLFTPGAFALGVFIGGGVMQDNSTWQHSNLQAIEARLAPVRAMADGVLYHDRESEHDILVFKDKGIVYLYFHALLDAEIQSRLALVQPLHLLSPYTQMVMLSLLWSDAPRRAFIIGLGGGRLPMVMHHLLPELRIDCAEIDRDVVAVAKRFFGVAEDARLRICVQDGRKILEAHPVSDPYDIIVVDAFIGVGSGPRVFATSEFFAACRARLMPQGVVAVNLLDNDTLRAQKRHTILESFPVVLSLRDEERGNEVLFGCVDASVTKEWLLSRAKGVDERYALGFSLESLARNVRILPRGVAGSLGGVLHDAQLLARLGRNDACHCGSGKKYKKCCG